MRPASSCRQPRLPYTSPRAGSAISSPNGVTRFCRGIYVVCAPMTLGTNWAGSYAYRARELHRPATLEALQEIVAGAPRIRVLGSRHTFNDIADSDALVSLASLPHDVELSGDTVSFGGDLRYGELARILE